MNRPKYEHIDHTADAGLRVYGRTLAELFAHAAEGLFDIIANLSKVKPVLRRTVRVEAPDLDALLVNWLSELNFLFFTEREIYKLFDVQEIHPTGLMAVIHGEPIDYERHEIYTEVKAVTYHHLYVKQTQDGWEAQVIFDL